jgi:hypothetical protein
MIEVFGSKFKLRIRRVTLAAMRLKELTITHLSFDDVVENCIISLNRDRHEPDWVLAAQQNRLLPTTAFNFKYLSCKVEPLKKADFIAYF